MVQQVPTDGRLNPQFPFPSNLVNVHGGDVCLCAGRYHLVSSDPSDRSRSTTAKMSDVAAATVDAYMPSLTSQARSMGR